MENHIVIKGKIVKEFIQSHEFGEQMFYRTFVVVERKSGKYDVFPVMIPESLITQPIDTFIGKYAMVEGSIASYNVKKGIRKGISHCIQANLFEYMDDLEEYKNSVFLEGFVCKEPVHRETKYGRIITDLFIANNSQEKAYYIPCLAWGMNSLEAAEFNVGDKIAITGRLQSRKFGKYFISQDDPENKIIVYKTVYEVSCSSVTLIEKSEKGENSNEFDIEKDYSRRF